VSPTRTDFFFRKSTSSLSCLLVVVVRSREKVKIAICNGKRSDLDVINGERPDLDVINGPDELVMLAQDWISRCWHRTASRRPFFKGV